MKIKTHIDKAFRQMEIHVCNNEMNSQVSELVDDLKRIFDGQLVGTDVNGNLYFQKKCYSFEKSIIIEIPGC